MENTITYKEASLFFEVKGKGAPVVLVHGVAEDGKIWQAQADFLSDRYRLIIPDLPGSGQSQDNGSVAMEDLADALKAILDAESTSQAVIIGHSMGGYAALAFAERYPEQLRALGLFHSSAFADGAEKIKTRDKNIAFLQKNGTAAFLQQATPTLFSEEFKKSHPDVSNALVEQYKDFDPGSLAAYQEAMKLRPDRTSVLKEFPKPVLFIIGKHDNAIPFEDSMKQCHLPSKSYIHILEKSGHMGMLEETEKANAILEQFLLDVHAQPGTSNE